MIDDGEPPHYVKDDYRIVHVRKASDGTMSRTYYSMVRLYIEAAILELDKLSKARDGVNRSTLAKRWYRRLPGKSVGERKW